VSHELGGNLILGCCYELLFEVKFKQALTKSFIWVSKMFLCWKIVKGVGVLELDEVFYSTIM
jgi:hypothetical protein